MQVVERIRSSCTFQVHKVTRMSGEGFLIKRSLMCTNFFFLMIYSFSVTSRRGPPTSRRQISVSLSRRDVDLPRRDVNLTPLCHVATWLSTSRRQISVSLPRRDVELPRRDVNLTPLCHVATWTSNVETWIFMTLCHVATLSLTWRRHLITCSFTSRR